MVNTLFNKAAMDFSLPEVVYGPVAEESDIPTIQGATIDGIIEIARGCGRGCGRACFLCAYASTLPLPLY